MSAVHMIRERGNAGRPASAAPWGRPTSAHDHHRDDAKSITRPSSAFARDRPSSAVAPGRSTAGGASKEPRVYGSWKSAAAATSKSRPASAPPRSPTDKVALSRTGGSNSSSGSSIKRKLLGTSGAVLSSGMQGHAQQRPVSAGPGARQEHHGHQGGHQGPSSSSSTRAASSAPRPWSADLHDILLSGSTTSQRPASSSGARKEDVVPGMRSMLAGRPPMAMTRPQLSWTPAAPTPSISTLLGARAAALAETEDSDDEQEGMLLVEEDEEEEEVLDDGPEEDAAGGPPKGAGRPVSAKKGGKAEWKNLLLSEGKKYKSAAVFMESKLLELEKLPRSLGKGDLNVFKTSVCCQILAQLSGQVGYFNNLLRRLAVELFASIYDGYEPPHSLENICDGVDFELLPHYTVSRRAQDEAKRLTKERDELKELNAKGREELAAMTDKVTELERRVGSLEMDRHMANVELRHERERGAQKEVEHARAIASSESRHDATRERLATAKSQIAALSAKFEGFVPAEAHRRLEKQLQDALDLSTEMREDVLRGLRSRLKTLAPPPQISPVSLIMHGAGGVDGEGASPKHSGTFIGSLRLPGESFKALVGGGLQRILGRWADHVLPRGCSQPLGAGQNWADLGDLIDLIATVSKESFPRSVGSETVEEVKARPMQERALVVSAKLEAAIGRGVVSASDLADGGDDGAGSGSKAVMIAVCGLFCRYPAMGTPSANDKSREEHLKEELSAGEELVRQMQQLAAKIQESEGQGQSQSMSRKFNQLFQNCLSALASAGEERRALTEERIEEAQAFRKVMSMAHEYVVMSLASRMSALRIAVTHSDISRGVAGAESASSKSKSSGGGGGGSSSGGGKSGKARRGLKTPPTAPSSSSAASSAQVSATPTPREGSSALASHHVAASGKQQGVNRGADGGGVSGGGGGGGGGGGLKLKIDSSAQGGEGGAGGGDTERSNASMSSVGSRRSRKGSVVAASRMSEYLANSREGSESGD